MIFDILKNSLRIWFTQKLQVFEFQKIFMDFCDGKQNQYSNSSLLLEFFEQHFNLNIYETYLNSLKSSFANEQEEGRAAETGKNPAGNFQDKSSERQADFWGY